MSEWISVEDRLPDINTDVLVFLKGCDDGMIQCKYEGESGFNPITLDYHGCGCCGGKRPEPSHWKPLDAPPKE